jgi:hypothetical protein
MLRLDAGESAVASGAHTGAGGGGGVGGGVVDGGGGWVTGGSWVLGVVGPGDEARTATIVTIATLRIVTTTRGSRRSMR